MSSEEIASAGPTGAAAVEPPVARGTLLFLLWCNALVFLTSVCIMVVELTASRLIAKSVGSSLYTWTSVIGVVLAGLSLGNFLGGWLADRYKRPERLLPYLFWVSSLLTLAIYPLHQTAGTNGRPDWASWPLWVMLVVAANFLAPAVALGTISPIAASMALSRSQRTGITVGNVYAWGSVGSIAGTFLTGFYLIDLLGTQNIIWMTAAALAVLGATAAAGQWVVRGLLLVGWLQFVLWIGAFASARADGTGTDDDKLAGALHEVGLQLELRKDRPDEYHDESNYFNINVGNRVEKGDVVASLILDHLTHSYINLKNPTELYYDYELVYAAVTERAVRDSIRTNSVPLPELPAQAAARLPPGVVYDRDAKVLTVQGAFNEQQRDDLLAASASAGYWKAVEKLTSETDVDLFAGLSSQALDGLPAGVEIPPDLARKVKYDDMLGALIRYDVLTPDEKRRLLDLAPDAPFRAAVDALFQKSRQVATFFIGGGGFVFPRWIEAKFPDNPIIHVAELDPAVKLAVQKAMGLKPDDQTAVVTLIGDARNTVDDRLRENARLAADGKPPLLYDFAYGDAFNDFSVPWHLTTQEFTRKVKTLLKPDGVYLVNIIDIFPQTRDPVGRAEVQVNAPRPKLLVPGSDWRPLGGAFPGIEARATDDGRSYNLRTATALTTAYGDSHEQAARQWFDAEAARSLFLAGVNDLRDASQQDASYAGPLPAAFKPEDELAFGWSPARPPYSSLEVRTVDEDARAFAYRGVMTEEELAAFLEVAADNAELRQVIERLFRNSQRHRAGRFLGSYVRTVCAEFPYVYVFASSESRPTDDRDTFVVACALRPLDLTDLGTSGGYWRGAPFAAQLRDSDGEPDLKGQMWALWQLSRGILLTDDYAPVDNMLIPVFADQ